MQLIYDSIVAASVTSELQHRITYAKIDKVYQPSALDIVLRMSTQHGRLSVFASANPVTPRLYITEQKLENPKMAPAFCMLLRKYIEGGSVREVIQPLGATERVIQFNIRQHDSDDVRLIFEVMGRHSNIILVNTAGTVLGSIKSIGAKLTRVREVRTGLRYQSPPPQAGKRDPLIAYSAIEDGNIAGLDAQKWLQSEFAGISLTLAEEAVKRSDTPATREHIAERVREIFADVTAGRVNPVLISDGPPLSAYPIRLNSVDQELQIPYQSICGALDVAYYENEKQARFSEELGRLSTSLSKALAHREHELIKLSTQINDTGRGDDYRKQGDLILASQNLVQPGMDSVLLIDYFVVSGEVERLIALDRNLSAYENAEAYYRKARNLRNSLPELTIREKRVRTEAAVLKFALAEIQSFHTVDQLTHLRIHVDKLVANFSGRTIGAQPLIGTKSQTRFDGHKIKSFVSDEGLEVLVGESASSNDYLTTRVAASSDIWLHVRASASAHGVIRTGRGTGDVPYSTIKFAAELVAARSESKHSQMIPVDYTIKKYVRKLRNSAPGAVTYQNEKTIYVAGIHGSSGTD